MKKKIGRVLLAVGISSLIGGIITAFVYGTMLVPVLLTGSIIINSVGITLIRDR